MFVACPASANWQVMESLQLSDIIRSASPEPSLLPTNHDTDEQQGAQELDALTEAEIIQMRRRVAEIASPTTGQTYTSSTERELVEMVNTA